MGDLINGKTPEQLKRWISSRVQCGTCTKEYAIDCAYSKRTEDCQMCVDSLAYICRLEMKRPRWISVEKCLPEYVETTLVYTELYVLGLSRYGTIQVATFIPHKKAWDGMPDGYRVTYWMPLPKPPKEDAHD